MKSTLGLLVALLVALPGFAHQVKLGDIEIIHPAIPLPPAGTRSAAGYMAISNEGAAADRLIGVEMAAAKSASLHQSVVSSDGIARMLPLDGIDVPAGDTIVLEPGAMHVMLMGLTQTFAEGDMVSAVLIFERAGRIPFEFMVDPPGGVDHSAMDHGAMAERPESSAEDMAEIEALLQAQFGRPDAGLAVAPISVEGAVAIAGWTQGAEAGRAFLRKDDRGWFVELCAGESLLLPATLISMGLTRAKAEALIATVKAAEAEAETNAGGGLVARMNAFAGTMVLGRAAQN